MKFARDYSEALEREDYPEQWLQSAISYRQLKKCIKMVQAELSALGLDADTLNVLWQSVGHDETLLLQRRRDMHNGEFHYGFTGKHLDNSIMMWAKLGYQGMPHPFDQSLHLPLTQIMDLPKTLGCPLTLESIF
jgi:hypothetical protein